MLHSPDKGASDPYSLHRIFVRKLNYNRCEKSKHKF
jgi:hypothetical protein